MNYLLTIVSFLSFLSITLAEDAKIGALRIAIPDGFVLRVGKGIDSQPGDITHSVSGWQIYYDIGIGAHYGGNEKIQKSFEGKIERKNIIKTPLGNGLLLVIGPEKRSAFFGIESVGYFKAAISSEQELKDFIAIVSSIRLSDDAEKAQKRPAQQD